MGDRVQVISVKKAYLSRDPDFTSGTDACTPRDAQPASVTRWQWPAHTLSWIAK